MSARQQAADRALERLRAAMETRTPACSGIDAFTADFVPKDERKPLERICDTCDLRILCRAYLVNERPKVGIWAGEYRGPKTKPKRL